MTISAAQLENISAMTLDSEVIVDGMKYEPFGELNEMNFSVSGIQTIINHNNKYQITSIQAGNIVNRAYTHDFDGNISSIKQLDSLPRPVIYSGIDTYISIRQRLAEYCC